MSKNSRSKRHKWRLPCEIVYEGGRQRSVVLDLSEGGLFVQTGARLRPGAEVEVRLKLETAAAPLVLRARVARMKQVPIQLTSVVQGGVGLALQRPPKAYLDAVAALEGGVHLRSQASPDQAPAPIAAARFRVRVKQRDGPRSRTLEIHADTPEQARAFALRDAGIGWEVVAADRIAS